MHMAAWGMAIAGARLVFLGADTPLIDITRAVRNSAARYLVLSASRSSDATTNENYVRTLLAEMPKSTRIIVGGEGFSNLALPDVLRIESFESLFQWFSNHNVESVSETPG
jgi:methanogenic corrinoid protein MtbC1